MVDNGFRAWFAVKLGVEKYEPPVKFTAPHILGPFDGSLRLKSGSERIQNLDWDETWAEINWVATEQLDGRSDFKVINNKYLLKHGG